MNTSDTTTPEDTITVDPALEICAQWIDEHGDPCDWCADTWRAYRNTIVHASNAGSL